MTKIDYKKELKHLYNPSTKAVGMVDVPAMTFLMIDGQGNPNTAQAYADAVEALFNVAYALKFMVKKQQGIDYGVMPLEGLWWAEDMSQFSVDKKEDWLWTMMIMQPEPVTETLFTEAVVQVQKKKNPAALSQIRFEAFAEGRAAQIMHLGPFSEEGPTIEHLHAFIEERGQLSGKHHEIYLSDIRKAAPQKWRTIIRQPMA
ncbi:MAG: GyrI-like domain-containing protein [Ardenticatenaceae bacterium]|nr:GyrI-like domain-containing protein [Ardenticatenaceae bacterium]